ncbi:MAG: endopeptidase La, partial [Chloroflexi bacterium]
MAEPEEQERLVLPVLPLKNTVVFPHVLVPLGVGRPRSLRLLEDLAPGDRTLAVAAQYDEQVEEATWDEVRHVGTIVRIQHLL